MNQYTPVLSAAAQAGDAWAQGVLRRCPELARTVPDGEYEELLDFADELGCRTTSGRRAAPPRKASSPRLT